MGGVGARVLDRENSEAFCFSDLALDILQFDLGAICNPATAPEDEIGDAMPSDGHFCTAVILRPPL